MSYSSTLTYIHSWFCLNVQSHSSHQIGIKYSKLTLFSATIHNSLWGLAWGEKRRRERILPCWLTHPHLIPQTSPCVHLGWPQVKHPFSVEVHSWPRLGLASLAPMVQGPHEATECVVSKVSSQLSHHQSISAPIPASISSSPSEDPVARGPGSNSELSDSSALQARM